MPGLLKKSALCQGATSVLPKTPQKQRALQAAEKLVSRPRKRQGTTSVVPQMP
jgi:hypothetical protein